MKLFFAFGMTQAVHVSTSMCMCCRSASLKPPTTQNPEDVLAELMELGPLGIPQSSSLDASSDPFASPLVTQAFTDVPAMSTGKHCQCHSLLEDANI